MDMQTIPASTPLTPANLQRAFEVNPDGARHAIFDFNKQALAQAMRTAGLRSVVVG